MNHKILLSKLKYYGVSELALNCFNSYLSYISKCIHIDSCKSNIIHVSVSVPQGSIFRSFFFTIYINDILNSSKFLKLIKYPDDTTSYVSISCLLILVKPIFFGNKNKQLESIRCCRPVTGLQHLINQAVSFVTDSGMTFNPSKTKCLVFGSNPFVTKPT